MPPRQIIRTLLLVIIPLAMTSVLLAGCLKGVQIVNTGSRYVIEYHPPTPTPYSTPTSDECAVYRGDVFQPVLGHPYRSIDELSQWVTDTFHLVAGESEFQIYPSTDEYPYDFMNWGFGAKRHYQFEQRFHLLGLNGDVESVGFGAPLNAHSLAHTLHCLGEPEAYIAEYFPAFEFMGPQIQIRLLYPEMGATVNTLHFAIDAPEPMTYTLAPHPMVFDPKMIEVGYIQYDAISTSAEKLLLRSWAPEYGGGWEGIDRESWYRRDLSMMHRWPKDGEPFYFDTRFRDSNWEELHRSLEGS